MADPTVAAAPRQPLPNSGTANRDDIGNRLREVFDEVATEPLPRAFEDLLRQLR